jgi:hypothetical protein
VSASDPPSTPPGGTPPGPPRPRCPATTKTGVRCIAPLKPGETFCYSHDPAREAERKADAATRRQPGDLGTELGSLDGIARRTAKVLEELETFAEVEDEETGEVIALEPVITPARASAKLNTLRLLAALVIKRQQPMKRKADDPGAGAGSLEELFG